MFIFVKNYTIFEGFVTFVHANNNNACDLEFLAKGFSSKKISDQSLIPGEIFLKKERKVK